MPNDRVQSPVRPVTPVAYANIAPFRPATDARRYTNGAEQLSGLRPWLLMLFAVGLSIPAVAYGDVEVVVAEYCQLDFDGARLSTDAYHRTGIGQRVLWHVEPGWDAVVVVRGFRIESSKSAATTATVRVVYDVAGLLAGDSFYSANAADQSSVVQELLDEESAVSFELQFTDGAWRIRSPVIHPHVGPVALIDDLRRSSRSDTVWAEELIRQLDELEPDQEGTKMSYDDRVQLTVRPVTPLACASGAPARPTN